MARPQRIEFDLEKALATLEELPYSPDLSGAVIDGSIIERLYDLGEINAETFTLASLEMFSRGLEDGRTTAGEISAYFANSEEETVAIPVSYLKTLGAGWRRYMEGPAGSTLGEAYRIEGGGAGKQKARDRLVQRATDFQLAVLVFGLRKQFQDHGNPISIEEACGFLANVWTDIGNEISSERIHLAYKRYGPQLVEEMKDAMDQLG